jgi:hypothetical protein
MHTLKSKEVSPRLSRLDSRDLARARSHNRSIQECMYDRMLGQTVARRDLFRTMYNNHDQAGMCVECSLVTQQDRGLRHVRAVFDCECILDSVTSAENRSRTLAPRLS